MADADDSAEECDLTSPVLDISQQALDSVFRSGDSALDNAVQRASKSIGQPSQSYAAHGTTP